MSKNKYLFFLSCIFLSILFFIFVSVGNAFASVDKIVFINSPQTIKMGEFSKQYQIQLQDENGATTTSSDTTYFTLPLDIGMFYSKTSGDPFTASSSIYISTGDSNKYFYFKSNTIGEYVMKVYARNKDNTKQWETEQTVKIVDATTTDSDNSNASTTDDNFTSNTTSATTSNTSNQSNQTTKIVTKIIYVSTHSNEEDLSDYNEQNNFEISAGRQRMSLVGSPIKFNAKYNIPQNEQCVPIFKWSFGDGFETSGKSVDYAYKYPGEYQAILNGTCGSNDATSRTTISIISPSIVMSNLPNDDIELINDGKTEINIGDWKMSGGQKDFIFPQDTIISAGKIIVLSKEDLNISSSTEKIFLNNPSGKAIVVIDKKISPKTTMASSTVNVSDTNMIPTESDYISVEQAESLLKEYKKNLALKNLPNISNSVAISVKEKSDNGANNTDKIIEQTASVAEAVSTTSKSFWANLINIPVNSVKSFARMFYNF